ncbi:MAG: hypothetical protein K6T94_16325 [Paenibacillus sp.]|nr:hypothetical protein [Paenibacillus sp.]
MKSNKSEIEEEILENCNQLVLELRGNQAENGNALINLERINQLHNQLKLYQMQIRNLDTVNKEIVGLLLYTCSRFYVQSHYSNNREELLKHFNHLNFALLNLYMSLETT